MDNSDEVAPQEVIAEATDTLAASVRAGDELPQRADLFRTLFLGHPDGVALVVKGKIALANHRFAEMSGYSTQEAIGMTPSELVVPEDQERLHDRIQDLHEQGDVYPSMYTLLCKDGSRLPIDAHSSPVQHKGETILISVIRDISKQREAEDAELETEESSREVAEKALRVSEERFSKAFHDNPVSVAITRVVDDKVIDANDSMLALTGYRRSEAIGRTTIELGVLLDPDVAEAAGVAMREHNMVRDLPARFQKKNGDLLHLLVSTTEIEVDSEACRLTTMVDITERRRLEEELHQIRDDLASKVERRMEGDNPYRLTFREFTVLHLVAAGKADKEIAAELGISVYTVHRHVSKVLAKMDSPSRTEAGTRALREGMLD